MSHQITSKKSIEEIRRNNFFYPLSRLRVMKAYGLVSSGTIQIVDDIMEAFVENSTSKLSKFCFSNETSGA